MTRGPEICVDSGGVHIPLARVVALRDELLVAFAKAQHASGWTLALPAATELVTAFADVAAGRVPTFASEPAPSPVGTIDRMRTPAEAAAETGLAAQSITRLCRQGRVRHERRGARGYLVDLDDLRRHLRRGKAAA